MFLRFRAVAKLAQDRRGFDANYSITRPLSKSIRVLYYLGTIFLAAAAVLSFAKVPFVAVVRMVFSVAFGIIGYGFRTLQRWIRVPVAILCEAERGPSQSFANLVKSSWSRSWRPNRKSLSD